MMKTTPALLLILILCLLISCGGGKTAVKASDPARPATKELSKGVGWYQKGCYHKSLPHLLRAHELFTALDDLPGVAMCMNNIGNVYRETGDPHSAILFFESAYDIYMGIGDSREASRSLSNKAAVLIRDGRLDEAETVLAEASDIAGDAGGRIVSLLNNQAVLLIRNKDYPGAENVLMKALDATDPQNPAETATVNYSLGTLMGKTGRYNDALEYFQKALSADRISGFHSGIADDLAAIGSVYQQMGNHSAAATYYQRSVKIYALLEDSPKVIEVMELLETSSQAGNVDITVTRHFVDKWAAGEVLKSPCH